MVQSIILWYHIGKGYFKKKWGSPMKDAAACRPIMNTWSAEELGINGFTFFGYCKYNKATEPLSVHSHGHCLEFIFLLKGEDTYTVENQSYRMRGGHIFVSFPGQKHASGEAHQGIGEYIWIQIDPVAEGNFLGLSDETSRMLRSALLNWDTHLFTGSRETILQAKRLYCAVRQNADRLYCIGQLVSLISLMLHSPGTAAETDDMIRLVTDYILAHLDRSLSIGELSRRFGMSESGFKHKFRRETGFTPRDYINRNRIIRAKEHLLRGNSVIRTAMDMGFNSGDYFSKVFRKYTMQTPTEFIRSVNHK